MAPNKKLVKKKRKKTEIRTSSIFIRSVLRRLFLYSKERTTALKRDKYTCQQCHYGKEDGIKVQVDHINGIDWEYVIEAIRETILCSHHHLQTLCKECHTRKTTLERYGKKIGKGEHDDY